MKRRLVRICVLLILGAIVNVAVAWAFAASAEKSFGPNFAFTRLSNGTDWVLVRQNEIGMTRIISYMPGCEYVNSAGLATRAPSELFASWSRIRDPVLPPDSANRLRTIGTGYGNSVPHQLVIDEAFGFPWRCLWCGWGSPIAFRYIPSTTYPSPPITHGVEIKPPDALGCKSQALPFGVLWLAFALNTVFYAGILWMLFAIPFALRRRLREGGRRRRGLCVKCGYDLQGRGSEASLCPECGAAVTAKAVHT